MIYNPSLPQITLIQGKKTQFTLDVIQTRTGWFMYIFLSRQLELIIPLVSYTFWIKIVSNGYTPQKQGLARMSANEHGYTTALLQLDEIEPESEKRVIFCLWCVEQKVLQ